MNPSLGFTCLSFSHQGSLNHKLDINLLRSYPICNRTDTTLKNSFDKILSLSVKKEDAKQSIHTVTKSPVSPSFHCFFFCGMSHTLNMSCHKLPNKIGVLLFTLETTYICITFPQISKTTNDYATVKLKCVLGKKYRFSYCSFFFSMKIFPSKTNVIRVHIP